MNKKIIFGIFLFFFIMPLFVNASVGSLVKVGNKYYDSLEDAINNVSSSETITLLSSFNVSDTILIDKVVNIDLNGNDIVANERVFLVQGGVLNLTGKGTIRESKPNYGAIMIKGSVDSRDEDYSVVNVGDNVTLEGWSGIFITHNNNKSYGVEVNFNGNINAVNDTSGGTGIGIYVNGNIKDSDNAPVVNIGKGASIKSTGNGLYIAGYSVFNITNANISGVESGIGIKSGILNIDGATVIGTGLDNTPTLGYGDGIKASGVSIQIESNSGYAGDIEINIDDGNFISKNSYALYEYIGKGNSSQVIALDISGGKFVSGTGKNNIFISDSLKEYHNNFISGGEYSNDSSVYLKPGYSMTYDNGVYKVVQSSMVSAFNYEDINDNKMIPIITIIGLSLIVIISLFINRYKLLNIFRKNLRIF